jgi:pyrroloquinoline quinone (PQQ) biosynthesis protein C
LELKYGPKGTTFLRVHSKEDVEHLNHAFKSIESLAPEKIKLVCDSFQQTIYLYDKFMDSIEEKFETPRISLEL